MFIRIRTLRLSGILFAISCLFAFASSSEASLSSVPTFRQQQPKDTQAPSIVVTSPSSILNVYQVFPEFKGTAVDNPQVNPPVPASGIAEVRASIATITISGFKYWDGSDWKIVTSPAQPPYVPVQLSGTTWSLKITPKLYTASDGSQQYFIFFDAIDREGNKGTASSIVVINPLEIGFFDAYLALKRGVDITSTLNQQDFETLADIARTNHDSISHIAVDGASKLIVYAKGTSPVRASFSKKHSSPQNDADDSLFSASSSGSPTNMLPQVTYSKEFYWFSIYTVLSKFSSEKAPQIEFKVWHSDENNEYPEINTKSQISLTYVPLLLIHGLWSNSATWRIPELESAVTSFGLPAKFGSYMYIIVTSKLGDRYNSSPAYMGEDYGVADYGSTSALPISDNRYVLYSNQGDGIFSLLEGYRKLGIACTKVDVVAHSMGGIIARLGIQLPIYKSRDNYNQGYVRRLITIGSPHSGSPLLDAAYGISQKDEFLARQIKSKFESQYGSVTGGAIEDMGVCSKALKNIPAISVSSYAIAGYDDSLILKYRVTHFMLENYYGYNLFGNARNDGVVDVQSQRGGMGSASEGIGELDHNSQPKSQSLAIRVGELLAGNSTTFSSSFPSGADLCPGNPLENSGQPAYFADPSQFQEGSPLTILSPPNNSIVNPGSQINISITTSSPMVEIQDLFVSVRLTEERKEEGDLRLINKPPFSHQYTVPSNYSGDITIEAFSVNKDKTVSVGEVKLTSKLLSPPTSLSISPSQSKLTSRGENLQLSVSGIFTGGARTDLSRLVSGTSYRSSNTNVASVNHDGLVSAISNGTATITVTNSGLTGQAAVTVGFETPSVELISLSEIAIGEQAKDIEIFGKDLGGATKIEFFLNGSPDSNISATILSINAPGAYSSIRAKINVAQSAPLGKRVLVVTTPGGVSQIEPVLRNVFNVVPRTSRTLGAPREPIKRPVGDRQIQP